MASQAVTVLPGDEGVPGEYTDEIPVVPRPLDDSIAPVATVISEEPEMVADVADEAQSVVVSPAPRRRRRAGATSIVEPAASASSAPATEGPAPEDKSVGGGTPGRKAPRTRRPTGKVETVDPYSAATLSPEKDAMGIEGIGTENEMEVTNVSNERDEEKGRDPNTFTGTKDAVDPETGAIGTAGTPVTTGYGVSGSTVGAGSRRRQKKQENDDYRGATPDSASYDVGGRGTGDAGVLRDTERQSSVVDRNSDAGRVEANIPRDTKGRDVYEQSEGYAESLDRDTVEPAATGQTGGTQESAGTNIRGTGDPRGLGDNTDE
jgi:hypothetical protein